MTKNWNEYKDVILNYYKVENKPLDEVKKLMETEHNFKASTRAYRSRFDKWRVTKYNTQRRRSLDTSEATSSPVRSHSSKSDSRSSSMDLGSEPSAVGSSLFDSQLYETLAAQTMQHLVASPKCLPSSLVTPSSPPSMRHPVPSIASPELQYSHIYLLAAPSDDSGSYENVQESSHRRLGLPAAMGHDPVDSLSWHTETFDG